MVVKGSQTVLSDYFANEVMLQLGYPVPRQRLVTYALDDEFDEICSLFRPVQ